MDQVFLILGQLLEQANLLCGILRSAMFQEFARHRLQHVKQSDLHVASVAQQGTHIAQGLGGVSRVIDGDQDSRENVIPARSCRREGREVKNATSLRLQTSEGERWNSATTGNASEAKSQYRIRIASEWVPA